MLVDVASWDFWAGIAVGITGWEDVELDMNGNVSLQLATINAARNKQRYGTKWTPPVRYVAGPFGQEILPEKGPTSHKGIREYKRKFSHEEKISRRAWPRGFRG
jgi:hypothetical protein